MKTLDILFFLFFFSPLGLGAFFAYAHLTHPPLPDSTLANAPEYISIEEAMKEDSLKVYKLDLRSNGLTQLPAEVF